MPEEHEYDGDTGRQFVNGRWEVASSTQNERFNQQAAWYRLESMIRSCPTCDGEGRIYMSQDEANAILCAPGWVDCPECLE